MLEEKYKEPVRAGGVRVPANSLCSSSSSLVVSPVITVEPLRQQMYTLVENGPLVPVRKGL